MNAAKAILFDLDGTLINSETFHYDCWNELLSPYNIHLNHDHYLKEYAGVSLMDNSQKLIDVYNLNMPVQVLAQKRAQMYLNRLAEHEMELMPYALETLGFFHNMHIPMGLVTSSSQAETALILDKCNLGRYFRVVTTRDDIANCKPHPEPYDVSVKILGFQARECLVFEDSLSGVLSAKAAGIRCFGIQQQAHETTKMTAVDDKIFCNLEQARKFIIHNNLLNIP